MKRLFDTPEAPPLPPSAPPAAGRAGPDRDEAGRDEADRVCHDRLPPAPTGGALSRCDRGMPFEWTLNPYRGCEFGCTYCYARYTHWYLGLDDPREFERRIFWKDDLPRLLGRDLERKVAPGQRIAVGTATDPWQPLERERGILRNCLRVLARREGLRLSLTTKSDLVLRDLDLLRVIRQKNAVHVNFTVTTMDRNLARSLEPRAPTPQRRMAAMKDLAAEGIETGVFLMPVLPGLTDGEGMLEEVVRAAAGAGAKYLCHQVVFLREPTRSFWTAYLRESHPALVARYESWFPGRSHAAEDLRHAVARRVGRARREAGLADGPEDRAPADPQLTLHFGG